MTTKKRGAELIFVEIDHVAGDRGLPGWDARLVNPDAIDRVTGKKARYVARIRYAKPYGAHDGYGEDAAIRGTYTDKAGETVTIWAERPYQVVTQGHEPGGRRYSSYPTLRAAQAALMEWARRRFYVEVEG